MAKIQIPEALLKYTDGHSQLVTTESSLEGVIRWLKQDQPSLGNILFSTNGSLCGYVNIYLDGQLVSDKLDQSLNIDANSNLDIVAAVSGG